MRTTRKIRDAHAEASTRPHNAAASHAACQIVRHILKLDGMQKIIEDDLEGNTGFIAMLCRNVDKTIDDIRDSEHDKAVQKAQDQAVAQELERRAAVRQEAQEVQKAREEIEDAQAYAYAPEQPPETLKAFTVFGLWSDTRQKFTETYYTSDVKEAEAAAMQTDHQGFELLVIVAIVAGSHEDLHEHDDPLIIAFN